MVSPQNLLCLLEEIWQRCADVSCDTFDLKRMKAETVRLRKPGVEFGRRYLHAPRKHDEFHVGERQLRDCLGGSALDIANGSEVRAATMRNAAFTVS
jgi:hypothetical protein